MGEEKDFIVDVRERQPEASGRVQSMAIKLGMIKSRKEGEWERMVEIVR